MTAKISKNSLYKNHTYAVRDSIRANVVGRYYNLWLSSRISKELSSSQTLYVMRAFWHDGKVAAFPLVAPIADVKALLGFASFVPYAWNMFDEPTKGTLINARGFDYIPHGEVAVGKDVVIGYAFADRVSGVYSLCAPFFDKIVNDEMAIYKEVQSLKKTRLFAASPDSYAQVNQEMEAVDSDQAFGVVSVQDPKAVTAVLGGTDGNVLQVLYNARSKDENALNTFLGFDNVGSFEKKERMNDGEVESNTAITQNYSDSIQMNLDAFGEDVAKAFGEGFRFSLIPTNAPKEEEAEAEETGEAENGGQPNGND